MLNRAYRPQQNIQKKRIISFKKILQFLFECPGNETKRSDRLGATRKSETKLGASWKNKEIFAARSDAYQLGMTRSFSEKILGQYPFKLT